MAPNLLRGSARGPEERRVRRKLIKHLVEKKRRGRINQCLDELRCLVLEALNRKPEQYEKMEKADILEMTVRYLRHARHTTTSMPAPHSAPKCQPSAAGPAHIKSEPGTPLSEPNTQAQQFYSGYRACVGEISSFLDSHTLPQELKQRLLGNIMRGSERLSGVVQPKPAQASPATPVQHPSMYPCGPAPEHHCYASTPSTMDIQCTVSVATPTAPKHFSARVVSSTSPPDHAPSYAPPTAPHTPTTTAPGKPLRMCKSNFSVRQEPSTVSFALSSPMWRPW